jgi:hypothetical protein
VSVYAAVDDEADVLRVMLVNKSPDDIVAVDLDVAGEPVTGDVRRFTYGPDHLDQVVADTVPGADTLSLGPYTVTVLEIVTR